MKTPPNPKKHKKEIVQWVIKNKRLPKINSQDLIERTLAYRLNSYTYTSQETYDSKFRRMFFKKFAHLRLKSRERSTISSKRAKLYILAWAEKHGRLPNYRSEDPRERKHGHRMENYLSKKSASFDPDFRSLIYSKYPRKSVDKRDHDNELRIKEVFDFLKEHNRVPYTGSSDQTERRIRQTLNNYTNTKDNRGRGGEAFEELVKSLDKCWRSGIPVKFRSCINVALKDAPLQEEKIK